MLTPTNDRDLELLDAFRLERFRKRFGQSLLNANLYISSLDRTLIISGGRETGALRYRTLDLLEQSWHICACMWVKVYQSNELIYSSDVACNKLKVDGVRSPHPFMHRGEKARGKYMATAIQEQAAAIQEQVDIETAENAGLAQSTGESGARAKVIRSMSLDDIAKDLEADTPSLQSFLEERNAILINFNGIILVTEAGAQVAYEHYSLVRARQKMQERFAVLSNADIQEKPKKNLTTKENKPKRNYLTWKKEFKVVKSSYKKTLQNALNALFPDAELQQAQALNDIIQQSDLGKGILDKITRDPAYTDKARVRDQLLKAAAELASDNNQMPAAIAARMSHPGKLAGSDEMEDEAAAGANS